MARLLFNPQNGGYWKLTRQGNRLLPGYACFTHAHADMNRDVEFRPVVFRRRVRPVPKTRSVRQIAVSDAGRALNGYRGVIGQ